jgi:hypothetical protein
VCVCVYIYIYTHTHTHTHTYILYKNIIHTYKVFHIKYIGTGGCNHVLHILKSCKSIHMSMQSI